MIARGWTHPPAVEGDDDDVAGRRTGPAGAKAGVEAQQFQARKGLADNAVVAHGEAGGDDGRDDDAGHHRRPRLQPRPRPRRAHVLLTFEAPAARPSHSRWGWAS